MKDNIKNNSLAVIDQGIFAVTNLFIGVILARWLTVHEFGLFATANAFFLLIATLHQNLILEPMVVFGAVQKTSAEKASFLINSIVFAALSLILIAAAGCFIAIMTGDLFLNGGKTDLLLYIAVSPVILISWTIRRQMYLYDRVGHSVIMQGIFAIVLWVGFLFLMNQQKFNLSLAIVVMGVAGTVCGVYGWGILLVLQRSLLDARLDLAATTSRYLGYGKWSVLSACVGWLGTNAVYFFVSSISTPTDTAKLKCLYYIAAPYLHLISALNLVHLPSLAAQHAASKNQKNSNIKNGHGRRYLIYFSALAIYGTVVLALAGPVTELLTKGKYSYSAANLVWLLFYCASATLASVVFNIARSRRDPIIIFISQLIGACFIAATAVALIQKFGYIAGIQLLIIGSVIPCLVCFTILRIRKAQ